MVGILNKRFKEIADRKMAMIKIKWFKPLDKEELDILGIKPYQKEDKLTL